MAGFEQSGLAGKESIRKGFQDCKDSADSFISTFQQENCVLLSSLHPALHLLDLQGVKRVNFHQTVISDLSERLLSRINNKSQCTDEKKLKELLDHTIQFIHVDSLRPVILGIMKKLTKIEPETIELISTNEKIYQDCPIEVKRHVWMEKHPLFGDAVGPILNKYIEEKQNLMYSIENVKLRNFFGLPPRQRRQKIIVKKLVEMIGSSIELYNLVLQFLRTLFLRTKEEHYCSLRSELLMAFHDADIKEIRQVDPCHKFTWCLDACVRDKSIDTRRLKELQAFLDGIKKGQEEVMGDIAMILCDPYATNTIAVSILHLLNKLVKMDVLPRSSSDIMFLIRLLTLSVGAWNMLKTQNFKEQPLNVDMITKFLPVLMASMIDCATPNLTDGGTPNIQLPPMLCDTLKEDSMCQLIVCYYINQLVQTNKSDILRSILPQFSEILKTQPLPPSVLNLFVHSFLRNEELFSKTEHCNLVFDKFLLVWAQHEDTLHHTLRLLWSVYQRVDNREIVRILTATQPAKQHSEVIHDLHAKLVDVIASSKASTPSGSEHSNSMSPAASPNILYQAGIAAS